MSVALVNVIINFGALILVLHFHKKNYVSSHIYNRGLRFSNFLDSRTDQIDCRMACQG